LLYACLVYIGLANLCFGFVSFLSKGWDILFLGGGAMFLE
jgi:hypothetical protein